MAVVGSADVAIRASIAQFERDLQRAVDRASGRFSVNVPIEIDEGDAVREAQSAVEAAERGAGDIDVGMDANVEGVEESTAGLFGLGAVAGRASSKLGSAAGAAGSLGTKLGPLGVAGAALAAGAGLLTVVNSASAVAEAQNKTNVIFGEAADSVLEFGETAADQLGQAESLALSAAGGFGIFAKNAGLSEQASADLSVSLSRIAADITSIQDVPLEQSLLAIQSGLAGETEALRRLGVSILEADKEQEALRLGLIEQGEELDKQSKIIATYSLIVKGTADQQGDFARTSEDFANATRRLGAQFEDLKANVGKFFIPAAEVVVESLNEMLGALNALLELDFAEFGRKLQDLVEGPASVQEGFKEQELQARALREELGLLGSLAVQFGIRDLTPEEEKAVKALIESYRDLDTETGELADAQKLADDATGGLTASIEEQAEAATELTQAVEDINVAAFERIQSERDLNQAREEATEAERVYQGVLNGFPATAQEVIDAQDALAEARLDARSATLDVREAELAQTDAVAELAEAREDLNNVLTGYAEGSEEATEAVEDLEDATRRVEQAQLDLKRAFLDVKRAQVEVEFESKLLGFVFQAFGKDSLAAKRAVVDFEETQLEVAQATADVKKAEDEVGDAKRDLTEQTRETDGVLHGFAETSEEVAEAQRRVEDAEIASARAAIALERAHRGAFDAAEDLRDAQFELRGVLEGFPRDSDRVRDALRELEDAEADVFRATRDLADKTEDLAEAESDFADALEKSNKLLGDRVGLVDALDGPAGGGLPEGGSGFRGSALQHGGRYPGGRGILVGEAGPEVLFPDSPGQVRTAAQARLDEPQTQDITVIVPPQPVSLKMDSTTVARLVLPGIRKVVRARDFSS